MRLNSESIKKNHGCIKCTLYDIKNKKCIKKLQSGGQAGTYCASYSENDNKEKNENI